jgi:glycosyltransferase involved in cell wall biosynthesis
MNILLVSHCDFTGNSALHVLALAKELADRGLTPAICVPADVDTAEDVGQRTFPVLTFDEIRSGEPPFVKGVPDIVHAFTPREHVRRITEVLVQRYGSPFIVHLEDNEQVIVADEVGMASSELSQLPAPVLDSLISPWRAHPHRANAFIERAAGVTAVIDSLLEFKPDAMPAAVFWPGFDEEVLGVRTDPRAIRRSLGIASDDVLLVYTGNVHHSNVREIRSLYLAVALLRRAGIAARLVKTGWNHVDIRLTDAHGLRDAVLDLGWVSRRRVAEIISAADVLVQPGSSGEFNDYRFPSKLPNFLASGRPVVLPKANIGMYLHDGENALLLEHGHAAEIAEKVHRIIVDPALAQQIGGAGRAFAIEQLSWTTNIQPVIELYETVTTNGTPRPVPAIQNGHSRLRPPVKLLAFYLPQFHPIPENDAWWGEGFTEWTSVRTAVSLFEHHYQPQLPGELGFYDLRDPTVLEGQAEMARKYGIFGFCFYYYWFNGRRVLERPVEQMLQRGEPRFPFCFCWANENWTRRWDGLDHEILLRQTYAGDWADRFIRELLPAFHDPRYIRVGDAALLLVYRANLLPEGPRVAERWREIARREAGLDLHLAAVQSFGLDDPAPYGFDAAVEFPPHTEHLPASLDNVRELDPAFDGFLEDYRLVRDRQLQQPLPRYRWYRGVMPSWDNTARRGSKAHVVLHSSPSEYQIWLRKLVLQSLVRAPIQEPLVFINAWNEWAEGTHLEPDDRFGRAWLESTRGALVDGVRQFYASRGPTLDHDQALAYVADALPEL